MLHVSICTLALAFLSGQSQALVPSKVSTSANIVAGIPQRSFVLNAQRQENEMVVENQQITRSSFISFTTATALSTLFPFVQKSNAEEEMESVSTTPVTTTSAPRSIEGCPKPINGKPNNCIATSNIKQLENYSPPWTFEVTPDEAFARLKGLMKTDASFQVVELDEVQKYMKVDVQRSFNTKDRIEFLVKGNDKVVVFKSAEIEGIGLSDLGINKKRVDDLRIKSGGVFRLMGDGLTADSYEQGKFGRGNGIGGQLKAFYGLQSGKGFSEVFEDD